MPYPESDNDAATKQYVDLKVQGLGQKFVVRGATLTGLNASYAGNVLTALANGALVQDNVTFKLGDRILVKDQPDATQNGIYDVTDVGSTTTPFVLTRSADFDNSPTGEVHPDDYVFVSEGTKNGDNGYVLTSDGEIQFGTTELTFVQFTGAGQIIAGDGLTKDGNRIDVVPGDGIAVLPDAITVKIDGTTLSKTAAGLRVAASGITPDELHTSVAGAGLVGGAGTALSINPGVGIELNGDEVAVKLNGATLEVTSQGLKISDGGVGTTQLASNSVTEAKIAASVAGNGLTGGNNSPLAVGAGDGIDVTADAVAVKVSDFVDTTKGLAVVNNDISVALDAVGGLEFNSGAIRLKSSIAGDGLTYANGVITVQTGNGIQIVSDAVALGALTQDWNLYNGTTYFAIKGIANPVGDHDAANKVFVQTSITNAMAGADKVEPFTLGASDITNKYITLASAPVAAGKVIVLIKGAPNQFYGEDFQMNSGSPTRLEWGGMGLDGLLEVGDKLTVSYKAAV